MGKQRYDACNIVLKRASDRPVLLRTGFTNYRQFTKFFKGSYSFTGRRMIELFPSFSGGGFNLIRVNSNFARTRSKLFFFSFLENLAILKISDFCSKSKVFFPARFNYL